MASRVDLPGDFISHSEACNCPKVNESNRKEIRSQRASCSGPPALLGTAAVCTLPTELVLKSRDGTWKAVHDTGHREKSTPGVSYASHGAGARALAFGGDITEHVFNSVQHPRMRHMIPASPLALSWMHTSIYGRVRSTAQLDNAINVRRKPSNNELGSLPQSGKGTGRQHDQCKFRFVVYHSPGRAGARLAPRRQVHHAQTLKRLPIADAVKGKMCGGPRQQCRGAKPESPGMRKRQKEQTTTRCLRTTQLA